MRKLVVFGAVVCLAAFLGSGVWPETTVSQDARLAAAGDSILSIPPCAFNEYEDGYDFFRHVELSLTTGAGSFHAPVNLPNGSVIKKVILICWDNGSSDIKLYLYRAPQSSAAETIDTVSSSGTGTGYRTFGQKLTSKKYVNTWKYAYYLRVWLPGAGGSTGYCFRQAKVIYTPPSS